MLGNLITVQDRFGSEHRVNDIYLNYLDGVYGASISIMAYSLDSHEKIIIKKAYLNAPHDLYLVCKTFCSLHEKLYSDDFKDEGGKDNG